MYCPRCNGKMKSMTYFDFIRSFEAYECLMCGEIIDNVIYANRLKNKNVTNSETLSK